MRASIPKCRTSSSAGRFWSHVPTSARRNPSTFPEVSLERPATKLHIGLSTNRTVLPVRRRSTCSKKVDFLLGVAGYLEGNCLVELEKRAAVERFERLSFNFKFHDHHRSCRFSVDLLSRVSVTTDSCDP